MLTFQDFQSRTDDLASFIRRAINEHMSSELYKTAKSADAYDRQKNETIYNYVRTIFTATGSEVVDFTAANNRLACNTFHRLNTQRCLYSLGNGVSFSDDSTKEKLGIDFDTKLKDIGYKGLTHGVCFGFWNVNELHMFPVTEFVPLWDEYDGTLRAGIRFWQLAENKPFVAVLYEEDGYTRFRTREGSRGLDLVIEEDKRAYKQRFSISMADGAELVGEENYGILPIVPLWGSKLHQSTLVGMQKNIDSYDLIQSGFANDLNDCAQIYWIVENCMGMSEEELARFRDRMKVQHIVVADTENSKVTPYTQEIPYQARQTYLEAIKTQIYHDFGAFDPETVAAGNITATQINAAYQPMDEEADDYEYQIIKFVQQILRLIGVEDTPIFKRNKVSNMTEQVQMVMMEAEYLDDETLLSKLPNITVDEIPVIMERKAADNMSRFEDESSEAVEAENTEENE